jgi:hypothetical protein
MAYIDELGADVLEMPYKVSFRSNSIKIQVKSLTAAAITHFLEAEQQRLLKMSL